jgi:hypothetical protein
MSINLKPNFLELGRNFAVLSFGACPNLKFGALSKTLFSKSQKTSAYQTSTFKWKWHIVFFDFYRVKISISSLPTFCHPFKVEHRKVFKACFIRISMIPDNKSDKRWYDMPHRKKTLIEESIIRESYPKPLEYPKPIISSRPVRELTPEQVKRFLSAQFPKRDEARDLQAIRTRLSALEAGNIPTPILGQSLPQRVADALYAARSSNSQQTTYTDSEVALVYRTVVKMETRADWLAQDSRRTEKTQRILREAGISFP